MFITAHVLFLITLTEIMADAVGFVCGVDLNSQFLWNMWKKKIKLFM